ncbi:MAG: thioesterase [Oscillospiraceae bacterium]
MIKEGYFFKDKEFDFGDCDFQKRVRLSTLMSSFTDVAGNAYTEKGFAHDYLWENGQVFLVSRMSIHIYKMPEAYQKVKIETWENKIKGVQFFREFRVHSGNEILLEASTSWVLVNPITRQILKPDSCIGHFNLNPDDVAKVIPQGKIKFPQQLNSVGKRTVRYSDLDFNGHLYNAFYSNIAMDYLPIDFVKKDLSDFRVNFKNEVKYGEELEILTAIEDNVAYVIGMVGDKTSFECEFTVK